MEQMDFVDRVFDAAPDKVVRNRNGDRQINFENKSLTADHLRLIYQDIVRKKNVYTQQDLKQLSFAGSRPCAVAPFFELAVQAGLCHSEMNGTKNVYKFNL